MKSSAIAHSNIALVKYWGRSRHHDPSLNIPLNDTVSMTKYGMTDDIHLQTHTTIEFSPEYNEDIVSVRGHEITGRHLERIINVIDELRSLAKIDYRFKMMSQNDFPTQAGLASSASAFAALTIAAADALGLRFSRENLSKIARLGSGSAARSIHGGFVYCYGGNSHETSYAEQICTLDCFDMHAVIAVVDSAKKEITSDEGHHLAHTSPFNEFRIEKSHQQAQELRRLILDNDFDAVGAIAEANCLYMHAVMMTSQPSLFYWQPATLNIIKTIQKLRKGGLPCYFTIDAGPNVHCLVQSKNMHEVQKLIGQIEGVKKTILVKPAEDAFVTGDHLF
ncbi:MAG: diphosphomevalonate decarboxylase [bacterium]|nr:diphosphomevalonate decarboxylase [bacterium]